jgi:pimeloyl-ACP methyl ester carboxylesterase
MPTNIFISYRRDDSGGHAGRILDRLTGEFGHQRLFFDVDSIPLGTNFPKMLREEVAKCGVLLAMIGPNWLDARNESGKRRLLDPDDFVRVEIAAALQRDIPVIPVLLDGAKIPKINKLPDELKELGSRNGIEVRHASFHSDMQRLIRGLKAQLDRVDTPQVDSAAEGAPVKREASDSSRIKEVLLQEHVVVVIHGIRDFALWQTNVRQALEAGGLKIELTNFMRLDLVRFLVPLPLFREAAIQKIWKQIEDIRLIYPNARISLIAHSFGTYILAEILRREFTFKAHRVIFCGSVVRYDFPFEQVKERFESPILNEVGTRDVWPAIAESVTWGYGSAGTYGFRRPRVRDRWHNGKNHSAFLNAEFCRKFWLPFLSDGTVVEGSAQPEPTRWWLQLLYVFRIKYVALGLGIILIWAIFFRSPSLLPQPVFPVAGTWDIDIRCPSGAGVHEFRAQFIEGRYARQFVAGNGLKGSTELVMGYEEEKNSVGILGRVIFSGTDVYEVTAKGTRDGSLYSGNGRFGSEQDCALTAKTD